MIRSLLKTPWDLVRLARAVRVLLDHLAEADKP